MSGSPCTQARSGQGNARPVRRPSKATHVLKAKQLSKAKQLVCGQARLLIKAEKQLAKATRQERKRKELEAAEAFLRSAGVDPEDAARSHAKKAKKDKNEKKDKREKKEKKR